MQAGAPLESHSSNLVFGSNHNSTWHVEHNCRDGSLWSYMPKSCSGGLQPIFGSSVPGGWAFTTGFKIA
eukprot:4763862-Amphidinium_carterae.1